MEDDKALVEQVADSIELAFTTQSQFPAAVLCRDEVNYKRIAECAIASVRRYEEQTARRVRFAMGAAKLYLEMERYTSNHAGRKECIRLLEEALAESGQQPSRDTLKQD